MLFSYDVLLVENSEKKRTKYTPELSVGMNYFYNLDLMAITLKIIHS